MPSLLNDGVYPARFESPSPGFGKVALVEARWHLVTASLPLGHFGLLLSMEDDPQQPAHIKKQSPAATVNDFLYLEPATAKTGFECIIRSSKEVLPNGPAKVRVKPSADLAGIDHDNLNPEFARSVPWDKPLTLEPWSPAERVERLGLPEKATKADGVPIPQNDDPALVISHGSAVD